MDLSVMASKLIQERIESNTGPKNYAIKKIVQALHYITLHKYGESANVQCASNAYTSIVLTVLKNISLWVSYKT